MTEAVLAQAPAATRQATPAAAVEARWHAICDVDEIWPNTGVCALSAHRQIAIFRLADGRLFALDNHDPHSGANVLSRGLVGDIAGAPVVASPIYKQHYRLADGSCVEDASTPVASYPVELRDGVVWLLV